MKKDITRNLPNGTLRLVTDTPSESRTASSPFGPVRAGLTNLRRTPDQQLTELLSCLENQIATLESKYLEVCATLIEGLTEVRAQLLVGILDTVGTDEV